MSLALVQLVLNDMAASIPVSAPLANALSTHQYVMAFAVVLAALLQVIEVFPREEARTAMALFGLGVMAGPTVGGTLGGSFGIAGTATLLSRETAIAKATLAERGPRCTRDPSCWSNSRE